MGDPTKNAQHEIICELQGKCQQLEKDLEEERTLRKRAEAELAAMTALKNSLQDVLEAIEKASGWQPNNEPHPEYIRRLKKERDSALQREDSLRRELIGHREKAQGNYWAWQGDNTDHLESLVTHCPVLIQAKDLQAILKERDEAQALAEEYRLKIPTTAQAMVYMDLLRRFEESEAKCAEMRSWISNVAGWHEGYCAECNSIRHTDNCTVPRLLSSDHVKGWVRVQELQPTIELLKWTHENWPNFFHDAASTCRFCKELARLKKLQADNLPTESSIDQAVKQLDRMAAKLFAEKNNQSSNE